MWQATTSFSVKTERNLHFPAITLCNNNPVNSGWYSQYVAHEAAENSSWSERKRRKRQIDVYDYADYDWSECLDCPESPPSYNSKFRSQVDLMEDVADLDYKDRIVSGHLLCDMVLEMSFGGESLNIDAAFHNWHHNPKYGNCYTFNLGYKVNESLALHKTKDLWELKIGGYSVDNGTYKSSQTGDHYGLYMLLNADVDHYIESTRAVGWRITVHNQTEMPFPEEEGIVVAPGTSTRMAISQHSISRLNNVYNYIYTSVYSNCSKDYKFVPNSKENVYSSMMEVAYSKPVCVFSFSFKFDRPIRLIECLK